MSIIVTAEEQCGLCCKTVIDNCDEALLCEGNCNKWLHGYCTGVTVTQYEALQDSPLPFLCSVCSQFKQTATISEMQAKINLLTAKVVELYSSVAELCMALELATSSTD